jgi:predicted transcriptional regulator
MAGPMIDTEATVTEIMDRLNGGAQVLTVTEGGRTVGTITPESVIGRLRG